MHTALIFREQTKVKKSGLRQRALSNLITQYNIFKGMIFFVTMHSNKIYIPQSLRIDKEDCPGTMNIYFIQDGKEQKRLS
jgi:hypothetical protein